MKRVSNLLMAVIRIAIIILVPIMTIVVFAQVVMRYVFVSPFIWAEELSTYVLIWVSCLGAAYAVRTGENIIVEFFPKRILRVLEPIVLISIVIFFSFTIFYAFQWCISEWTQFSSALGIRLTWIHAGIFVGFGLALFFALELLFNRIRDAFPKGLFGSKNTNVNKGEIDT